MSTRSPQHDTPRRIAWASRALAVDGAARVLEIGCGSGELVRWLVALPGIRRVVGVDRSAAAIATARRRQRAATPLSPVRVEWRCAALADVALRERFDALVAVNVNVFWRSAAVANELQAARRLLAGDGRLYLFYDAPSAAQAGRILVALRDVLCAHDWAVERMRPPARSPATLVGMVARPGGRGRSGARA